MICRVCDASTLSLAIDLGMQPRANHFLRKEEIGQEPFYPLRVVFCHRCSTAQLDYTVKKEVVNSGHTYLSGVTQSLSNHFREIAEEVDSRFFSGKKQKSCLDIGSNDGTQLIHYQNLGYEVLGVEASDVVAKIANEKRVPTLHAFFNLETAKRIGKKFDLFNAAGVFFHLEELHSVTEAIHSFLSEEGVFVVQFIYLKSMMENTAFDQIYHEHLLYYTLKTLDTLLQRHGLELFDAHEAPIHGGSIIGFAGHRGKRPISQRLFEMKTIEEASGCNEFTAYAKWAKKIEALKRKNKAFLESRKKEGKQIFGLGAPVKGNTLLNYFGIGTETLEILVEKNRLRKGLYSPGKYIPILLEEEVKSIPNVYYVLAWNFKNEILHTHRHLLEQDIEFYFPIGGE